jgi:hypothetical protein
MINPCNAIKDYGIEGGISVEEKPSSFRNHYNSSAPPPLLEGRKSVKKKITLILFALLLLCTQFSGIAVTTTIVSN